MMLGTRSRPLQTGNSLLVRLDYLKQHPHQPVSLLVRISTPSPSNKPRFLCSPKFTFSRSKYRFMTITKRAFTGKTDPPHACVVTLKWKQIVKNV